MHIDFGKFYVATTEMCHSYDAVNFMKLGSRLIHTYIRSQYFKA